MKRVQAALAWVLTHAVAVLVGALLLAGILVQRGCSRTAELDRQLQAERDRTAATAAGVPVVQPVEDLRPALNKALEENAVLREALARARRAVPSARPIAVAQASTGPVPAAGEPRPAAPEPAPCLLSPGDSTETKVDEVLLESKAGAHLLVGSVTTWRLDPGPATPIASGGFEAPFTLAVEQVIRERTSGRLAFGPVVGATGDGGLVYGGAVSWRALSLGAWEFELLGLGSGGPGGLTAHAGLLVRR